MHPDVLGPDAGEDAVLKFQELTQEYTRLLESCKTDVEREVLRRAWMSLGGLTAAASLAISDPAMAAIFLGSVGTFAILPNATNALSGIVWPTGGLRASSAAAAGDDDAGSSTASARLSKALRALTPLADETVTATKRILSSLGSATQETPGGLPMGDGMSVAACVEAHTVAESEAAARASLMETARAASHAADLQTAAASDLVERLRPPVEAAQSDFENAGLACTEALRTADAGSGRRRARQAALRAKRRADAESAAVVRREAQEALAAQESVARELGAAADGLHADFERARAMYEEAARTAAVLEDAVAEARERQRVALATQERRARAEAEARRVAQAASVAGTALAEAAVVAAKAAEKAAEHLEVKQRARWRKNRRESGRGGS